MADIEKQPKPSLHRTREIPWLQVVKFHKEIVTRAEEGFFALNGKDDQSERWSSLQGFLPDRMAGPWEVNPAGIQSRPFRLSMEQGQVENIFLGGPCYLKWTKVFNGSWIANWCPLFYREVSIVFDGSKFRITPTQGNWNLSPFISSLVDRLELNLGIPIDELASKIIEDSIRELPGSDLPLAQVILEVLSRKYPALGSALISKGRSNDFRVQPSPWVLFAPTNSFSALTRYLMQDYERLEANLVANNPDFGGLRLLDDLPEPDVHDSSDILPLIPLNNSQKDAVQRILDLNPLTVISGPPGTGKSQIVVSLLLNAWAQGKSVLFASNNNKAVDVVRERVERFESEFPIAVRAGNKQKQNIQEVLRKTLNLAGTKDGKTGGGLDTTMAFAKREELQQERSRLQETLGSQMPQRLDEALRASLSAYGVHRDRLAKILERETEIEAEQVSLGFRGWEPQAILLSEQETRTWLGSIDKHRELTHQDDVLRDLLQAEVADLERQRDREVENIGLQAAPINDWQWLATGPSPELASDWEQRFRSFITGTLEPALEPFHWSTTFDRWKSSEDAGRWGDSARAFRERILQECQELSPKVQKVKLLDKATEQQRSRLKQWDLPEGIKVSDEALSGWSHCFAEMATLEPGKFDFLPWSRRAQLKREQKRHFRQFRPSLPLSLLASLGAMEGSRQIELVPIVETIQHWIHLREEAIAIRPLQEEIEARLGALRNIASQLRVSSPMEGINLSSWPSVVDQIEGDSLIADQAAQAWGRRVEKERVEASLRNLAQEWLRFGGGVPIRDAWRHGQGEAFEIAIRQLAKNPDLETLAGARRELYAGRLIDLITCWQTACEIQTTINRRNVSIRRIPRLPDRIKGWYSERPKHSLVLDRLALTTGWPDLDEFIAKLDSVRNWGTRWKEYSNQELPTLQREASSEIAWAVSKLEQTVKLLPESQGKPVIIAVIRQIAGDPHSDWPISELNRSFAAFSPEQIKGRISRIEAELERTSFLDAKGQWLRRLKEDEKAIMAVDALEKSIRLNKGEVRPEAYPTFRDALRLVPIWITTAQAAQAIPLLGGVFDIVVIDEASQCTLTNLLPLMYRAKSLVVIGDDQQLPAIPTIHETEEQMLAHKHGIEGFLHLVGHATNDVYRTAAECLPRRRADVIMLEEHFRSHPQIIGFSNRHIYGHRLELKKDPQWGERLSIGSGVHSVHVPGLVRRGERERSWVNEIEAKAVLELVAKLKQGDSRSLSLGVVTPFSAHKDYLRNGIESLGLASEVLVDTANGFQGDERDVMIFSPVVSKGIQDSASRWVESPPNLINVAITRAKEALFVVGDLDYCMMQDGILKKLAIYCREVQTLRDTSPAELELFSWMMVKGWAPKVHPRVGDIEVDFMLSGGSGNKLAIEVDGRAFHEQSKEKDDARDAYLRGRGYEVIRIPAREIFETPFEVIHQISNFL